MTCAEGGGKPRRNADNQPYSVDFLWTGKKLEKDAARVLRGRAPRQ
jgi:hypothetical protein